MAVNNSDRIRSLLSFNKDDFYFLQIIKRRKDNPSLELGSLTLKNYYINSFEDYDKFVPIVKRQCDFENARAYFRLNKRNYKNLGLKVVNRALVYITSDNYSPLCNVFDKVAGECPSDPIRKWVIDVDSETIGKEIRYSQYQDGHLLFESGCAEISRVNSTLVMLQNLTKNTPMGIFLPTKNGIHIITRPFNLAAFKKEYPKLDVHKDATTILYTP